MRLFLVAAEASGDALGADLMRALRARDPAIAIGAVGGPAMAKEGAQSPVDISGLSVLGLFDGLRIYGRVVKAADDAAAAAIAFRADAVVLIDSWGFTMRVAQRLRKRAPSLPLIKYIGPQVWATRPGRAKTLAGLVDHLLCIFDFEPQFYAPYGLSCTVCGHPAIGRERKGDAAAFRAKHGLGDAPLLLVLPGSRRAELRRTAPDLWAAARTLAAENPNLRIAGVAADAVAPEARAQAQALAPAGAIIIDEAEKENAFAASTLVLATSGTVTTEVALQGAPMIVGYRLGALTWAVARALKLYKPPFITLFNIAANKEIAPEFLQTRLTPENLAAAARPLLADVSKRAAQVEAQNAALKKMRRGNRPAAEIAADIVMRVAARAD
ncbi:MAG: lipid-A-disaccharide synthase [Hyphomonadaceae bacterium]